MHTLIYSSALTGIVAALTTLYIIWFDGSTVAVKLLVTFVILFILQVVGYLVLRDIKEEGTGKDDGTIARS